MAIILFKNGAFKICNAFSYQHEIEAGWSLTKEPEVPEVKEPEVPEVKEPEVPEVKEPEVPEVKELEVLSAPGTIEALEAPELSLTERLKKVTNKG